MENIVVFEEGPESGLFDDKSLLAVIGRLLGEDRNLTIRRIQVEPFSGNSYDLMLLAHSWLQEALTPNGAAIVIPLEHKVAELLAQLAFYKTKLPVIRPTTQLVIGRSPEGFGGFQHILPTGEPKDLK